MVFLALTTGCAGLAPGPTANLGVLSKNAVRLTLPYEAQTAADLCGIASVDMLTGYYHKPLSAAEQTGLQEEAKTTDGISGATLKATLEEAGYYVAVFQGTLDHQESGLYHQIDLKRPCIVMTGTSPRHYSVAVGYDPDTAMIVLLDPAIGQVAVPVQSFVSDWNQANNFTLLAVPTAK
jgi:ABC-type bacteriocin/lantibiotic exporter with double-glycine peptidase domain